MARRSPGGVGDGLPSLPSGEPLLARWFAIGILVLGAVGLAITVWALTSIRTTDLPPAARRPPGTAEVTHDRGAAVLAEADEEQTGVACAPDVRLVGDPGGRAAAERALSTVCSLLTRDEAGLAPAGEGLELLDDAGGVIRIAVFERNGVDSSSRVEDDVPVVELNAKFQFERAALAAPFLLHELAHIGSGRWPGEPVDVDTELRALQVQALACELLVLPDDPPRGCADAAEVLDLDDPEAALEAAGYQR